MDRRTVAAITLVGHAALAVGVSVHACVTGREAGWWPHVTLVGGVFGVVGYALDSESGDR